MKEDSQTNDKIPTNQQLMEILKTETEDVSFRKAMKRFPLSYQDPGGRSLVSLIILNSKSPLKHARIIQQMGYSVSTPDKNGWTPLHHTVHGCQVKLDRAGLILLLLANGVKIDVKTTNEGLSSFMIACTMGDVQLAELLLARGASIHNTDRYGNSALHLAAQHSKLNMVQFLLYRGLTANCRNIHNQSPDMIVGEKGTDAERKSNKKIRHILQENGKLQKKLAKHYKEKLRAERKERESLENESISSRWEFSCCELLEQLEIALCGPIQKQVDDDFEPPAYQQIHRNVVTVSESVARDPSSGFTAFTRPLS
jgi:hypothetical protein